MLSLLYKVEPTVDVELGWTAEPPTGQVLRHARIVARVLQPTPAVHTGQHIHPHRGPRRWVQCGQRRIARSQSIVETKISEKLTV